MPRRPSLLRCIAVLAGLCLGAAAAAHTVTIAGAGAGMGTMRLLGAEFERSSPGDTLKIVPNLGTAGGMKAMIAGAIDLAVTSRAPSADETARGLVAMPYGRTPLVIAVNVQNTASVRDFTELADVYAGRRTDWPDGVPIRLVMRPRLVLESRLQERLSPALKQAIATAHSRPGMVVAPSAQDAAAYIERTPGAIGVTSLSVILSEGRRVRVLPVNGITPGVSTLADGSYPYGKDMLLIRRADASAVVKRFEAFIASPRAQQILAETGHLTALRPNPR